MRIALVCDDLIQHGGAERVVEEISNIFPGAPIYTSIASKQWLERLNKKGRVVKTSFLQKFPFSVVLNRYYSPFLFHVLAFESFDFSDFDIVISCSSRFAHFIITKPTTRHICYMNSPGRMFWEPFDYFERENYGILKPIKFLSKPFLKLPLLYLRLADFNASKKVDVFIANSKIAQQRVRKYYNRDSNIVYPFIDFDNFKNVKPERGEYFLVLTRLAPWKRVDIAIGACQSLGEKLKIIGDGPDFKRLKSMADSSTEFLGYIGDEEKIDVISKCKAVIITQKEDFGIVPLEVMACGKPVIAFGEGGSTETVIPGKTGEFFEEQNFNCLGSVIKSFNPENYLPGDCKSRAENFDRSIFERELKRFIHV